MGQGNIFRSMCQEFCPQVGWYPSMPLQVSRWGGIPACLAGLQAHTRGEVEGSGQGVPRPTPGVSMPTPRGISRPTPRGCIPACTEADPPLMATATGATHPTGMHTCLPIILCWVFNNIDVKLTTGAIYVIQMLILLTLHLHWAELHWKEQLILLGWHRKMSIWCERRWSLKNKI